MSWAISAFAGKDAAGRAVDLHYVVIPYHGGTVKNLALSGLSQIDSLTAATSHEIAEAATDPDIGYKTPGWLMAASATRRSATSPTMKWSDLNGSAVECLADQKDRAMTPMGATAFRSVQFVLQDNGTLTESMPTASSRSMRVPPTATQLERWLR